MANGRTGRSPEGRVRKAPANGGRRSDGRIRQKETRRAVKQRSASARQQPQRKRSTGSKHPVRKKKRGFSSWSIGKKIAAVLGGTLVLLITAGVGIIASKMSKIETVELDAESLNISEEIEHNETGYLNVALFGLDTRASDPTMGSRSDTIIIASLNRETGEIRLASIYRDTMLQQKDGSYNKANAAYAFGGATDAIAMLNKNLDMDIQHYVSVDFAALVDVIDALGGVEIDVTEEEIPYLNNYAVEVIENTGVDSAPVTQAGLQTLNGVQATGYARIRYTQGDDFKRTERQRAVIEQIVKKLQSSDIRTVNKIIDEVFPKVQTNFTLTEILAYAKNFMNYKMGETQGFPTDNTTARLTGIGDTVIPQTLESNVKELHKFFFGEDGYSPSSTVTSLSSEITSKSTSLAAGSDYDDYEDDYYDYSYDYSYEDDTYDNSYDDSYDSSYDSSYDDSYDDSYDSNGNGYYDDEDDW